MFRHLAWVFVLVLSMVPAAHAEISTPDLTALADGYRAGLPRIQGTPEQVLRNLSDARKAGDAAAIVRWSEALVAQGDQSAQSWLNLSKAWMQSDPAASNGLAAAVEAERLARSGGDRLEALLLVSSFLRARLEKDRLRYEDALSRADAADKGLEQLDYLEGDVLQPDPDNPEGRPKVLERTRDEANAESKAAAADISGTAVALDEIYRAIQAAIPAGVAAPDGEVGQMQLGDQRLQFEITDTKYEFSGNDVRACVAFNKTLKQDSLVYGDLVQVTRLGEEESVVGPESVVLDRQEFDVRAESNMLCLLRLEPGRSYELLLRAGLPSEDDSALAADLPTMLYVQDLPSSVGFGDGELILPQTGPGQLPISIVNRDEFPLSLHHLVDRSLYRPLALGMIRNGIPNSEYQELLARFSEVLWQGTAKLKLDDEKDWNTTVRSSVPVGSILRDRGDWLANVHPGDGNREGELSSALRPVRDISDARLSIEGRFRAGALDVQPQTAGLVNPGLYALVAQVPRPDGDDIFAAQWFLRSNLGLTFYEGASEFTVLVRTIDSGDAVKGAKVQLVAQGNRLLAEKASDDNGVVVFERSLTRGDGSNALIAIMVETANDFNFLQYGGERLDLSRLNVGGAAEESQGRALIYTDRGIYQPGEKILAFSLMRERSKLDPLLQTAELRLDIGDYTVARHQLKPADWAAGGSMVPLAVPTTARPGRAVLKLVTGVNDVVAESGLQIGKIRPDRARLDFRSDAGAGIAATRTGTNRADISARVRAQYLYGAAGTAQAPAANLKAEVTVRVAPADVPPGGCYGGFAFGKLDDTGLSAVSRNRVEFTDEKGMLDLDLAGIRLPTTSKPLVATVEVTVFDAAGPVASGQEQVAIPPEQLSLGIAARPRISSQETGYQLALDILSVDTASTAAFGRDVEILVQRESETYAWTQVDDVWQHITQPHHEEISKKVLQVQGPAGSTPDGCPAHGSTEEAAPELAAGRYVVTVKDLASGAVASQRFVTGVAQTSVTDLEPNLFVLSSDKARYTPGEQVVLSVDAPFRGGKVVVAVAAGDILGWFSGDVTDGRATISFPADRAWAGKGLHALATVFKQDAANTRQLGPSRAIGATYFEVSNEGAFEVSVRRPTLSEHDSIRPGEPLSFDVCVQAEGGECGSFKEDAYAVAYVVDEGLLNLTGHSAEFAAIEEEFFGRHKLGLRVMDNYGRLLLHEGGDRPGRMALSNYTSARIVADAQGPKKLEDGRASFTFSDPGLQTGTLRVFVIAWTVGQVSTAAHDVAVRNLLVSSLGVPEFFLAGDKPELPLRLENIAFSDHRGDYALTLSTGGGISARLLQADGTALNADPGGAFLLPIPRGAPQDLRVALDIPSKLSGEFELSLGIAAVGADVDLPPEERSRKWTLAVRSPAVAVQEYLPPIPLQAQPANLVRVLEGVIEGRYDPDTVSVTARITGEGDALRLAAADADTVPAKSILEDSVWRGMIDLQDRASENDPATRARVQANADAVQALQLVDGSFAPYRTDGDFIPAESGADRTRYRLLGNVSAVDFLIRAHGAGYSVSADTIRNALAFVQARVDTVFDVYGGEAHPRDPVSLCSFDTRYAMLVLAQQDRLNRAYLDTLDACEADGGEATEEFAEETEDTEDTANGNVFSELVTQAVLSQYGEVVKPEETLAAYYAEPADYLNDLDSYRKAIAVSMLANARADKDTVKRAAETLLKPGKPLDLRTRAWLARTMADLDLPEGSRLNVADIDVSDADLMQLAALPSGVLESAEITYRDIEDAELELGRSGGPEARAYLRVSGQRVDSADMALPESSLRRRLFCVSNGKEIDLATQKVEVGDDLVVVVEATRAAFADFDQQALAELGTTYGPVMVDALLPSAFALYADDLTGVEARGVLKELSMAGSRRAVQSASQDWKAIIVPVSSAQKFQADKQMQGGGGEEGDPQADGEGAAPDPIAVAEEGIEFRQSFVVTVTAAGSFVFPPTTIEALDFPGNTLVSSTTKFEVGGTGPCRRN